MSYTLSIRNPNNGNSHRLEFEDVEVAESYFARAYDRGLLCALLNVAEYESTIMMRSASHYTFESFYCNGYPLEYAREHAMNQRGMMYNSLGLLLSS